jgi:hypothetical protein
MHRNLVFTLNILDQQVMGKERKFGDLYAGKIMTDEVVVEAD